MLLNASVPPKSYDLQRFFWLFSLIFVVLLTVHFSDYFLIPHHQKGDEAVNALQIIEAKAWHEIHGHYSRWGFNHPGPVYFYLYAWGEWLFFDVLGWVPAPDNAHFLTGLLIQSGFLAAAWIIVSRWSLNPWFLPVALLLAAVHFGLARNAFYSLWPPHTLLFPFLCFLVACAAMAAGDGRLLPLVCLAGGFLVHNHVAQPLFVLPLFVVAYVALARRLAETDPRSFWQRPSRAWPGQHLVSLLLVLLFLLPILIDLSRLADSNFYAIWQHLQRSEADHKTMAQAVLYLFSFLAYQAQPELYVDTVGRESLAFLGQQVGYFIVWALVLLLPLLWWGKALWVSQTSRFAGLRWLYGFFVMAVGLTAVWGMLQSGSMFQFNGYFNFALLFVPVLLLALVAAEMLAKIESRGKQVGVLTAVLTLTIFSLRQQNFRANDWDPQLLVPILAADNPQPIKYLAFEQAEWALAAGVALELKRAGYDFRVPIAWDFMFGQSQTITQAQQILVEPLTIWHFAPAPTQLPSLSLTGADQIYLSLSHPGEINPQNGSIRFDSAGNASHYKGIGWARNATEFTWSTDRVATLTFLPQAAPSDVNMTIVAAPYLGGDKLAEQRMSLYLNEHWLGTLSLAQPQVVTVSIPAEVWNQTDTATLIAEFPDAVSPWSLGLSQDRRLLGFSVAQIWFSLAEP